jgi:NAD(P)H-dependent FMN reductase
MEKLNVLVLVGGISRNSLNKKYFEAIRRLGLEEFNFVTFDISKLPFFSQDLENDPPDVVTQFKEKIRETDALLLISPEYNRSFPGVLKNALDWGSRPYGQNLWEKKVAGVLGASPGNIGTFGAQHHLRQVLSYLDVQVVNQPEIYFNATNAFNETGDFSSEKTVSLLQKYFEAFYALARTEPLSSGQHYPSKGLEDSPVPH